MFFLLIACPANLFWYFKREFKAAQLLAPTIFLLVAISLFSCLGNGYYLGKWISIGVAAALITTAEIYKRYGAAAAALFFYLMCDSVWATIYVNRYSNVKPYDLMGIQLFAVQSAWKLAFLVAPLLFLRTSLASLRFWGRALCIIFFTVSAAKVGWEWVFDPKHCSGVNDCGGALLNPSLNSAMMAVVLPFMPFPLMAAAVATGCAFLGKTSIGAGMVALFLAIHALFSKPHKEWAIPLLFLGVPAIFALGILTHGNKDFFNSSGRFQMWIFFMKLWAINPKNWIFGTGFGTFGVFSVNLQHVFSMNQGDWWIWLHNDWLQMLFEGGVMGFTLMAWLYISAARQLFKRGFYPEFGSLALFGVMMGCEYGLHIGPCCAYAAWISAVALMKLDACAS